MNVAVLSINICGSERVVAALLDYERAPSPRLRWSGVGLAHARLGSADR